MSAFGNPPPRQIAYEGIVGSGNVPQVLGWSATAHVFFMSAGNGIFTVNLEGQITPVDIPNIYSSNTLYSNVNGQATVFKVSPNGREWALFSSEGLWIASPDHPSKQISLDSIDDVLWSPDGSALLFIANATLYRVNLPDYQVQTLAGPFSTGDSGNTGSFKLAWVMP